MKASFLKLLKIFCAFAFLCLSGVTATAQIKVVGDDYRTNTKDISIMSIPFNPDETLPEYSGKTQYFGDYSWRPVNILGERFYLPESSVMLYLYTDTLANEYRIDTLPANKYYTVTALDVKYFKDSGPDSYSDLYGKYNNGYYTTFVDFVNLVREKIIQHLKSHIDNRDKHIVNFIYGCFNRCVYQILQKSNHIRA